MAPYRSAINQFLGHFIKQGADIDRVASPFHQKILYTTALEPLARAAFGTTGSHRSRIVRLLVEVAKWPDAERVSPPQLVLRLKEARRYRHRLYRTTSRQLAQWESGGRMLLSQSPQVAEALAAAAPEEHEIVRDVQYAHLFYTYRNNLVHEFREPGYGTDWSGKSGDPFYGSSINGPWELVFPVAFVAGLYRDALIGLRAHLSSQKIDPYTQFQFGSLWRAR